MKRRDFLKGILATSFTLAGTASVLTPLAALAKMGATGRDDWLTTGSHFGAFKIKRKNGVIY